MNSINVEAYIRKILLVCIDQAALTLLMHSGVSKLLFLLVQVETSRIVYSWNYNDPVVTMLTSGSETYSLNQHNIAKSTSLNLLGGNPSSPDDPSGLQTFTVGGTNVS